MQKKILASLLMVPMAYSAFANIGVDVKVNKDAWTADGLVGDNLEYNASTNTLTSGPVGVGSIAQTLKDMPQGTYTLSFTSKTNTLVKVNGTALAADGKFTLAAKGDIAITVSAENPSEGFKFTGLTLEIDCDFTAIGERLSTRFGTNYKINEILAEALAANFQNSAALNTQKSELTAKVNTLRENIVKVKGGEKLSNAEKLELYNEFHLWGDAATQPTTTLDAELDSFKTQVDNLNKQIDDLNTAWTNTQTNTTAKAALLAEVEQLQQNLDNAEAAIKAAVETPKYSDYAQYINDKTAAVNGIQAEIDAYKAAIEAAYADDKLADKITFESKKDAIQAEIEAVNYARAQATGMLDHYVEWLSATRDFLANYKDNSSEVAAIQGIEGYDGKYLDNFNEKLKPETQEALEAIYNKTVAAFQVKEAKAADNFKQIDTATEANLNADKKAMTAAKAELEETAQKAVDQAKALNTALSEDLNQLGTTDGELSRLEALLEKLPEGSKAAAGLAEETAALRAKYNEILGKVDAAYADYTLTDTMFDDEINNFTEDVAHLLAIAEPILDLYEKLEAAKEDLNEKYGEKSANAKIFDGKFIPKFDTVIANITDAIANIPVKDANGDAASVVEDANGNLTIGGVPLKDIEDAIANIGTTAEQLSKAWVDAYNQYDFMTNEFAALTDLFKNKLFLNKDYRATLEADIKALPAYPMAVAKYEELKGKYEAAVDIVNGQDCYDAMLALANFINEDSYTATFNGWMKRFDLAGTGNNPNGNYGVVNVAIANLKNEAKGTYAGKTEIDTEVQALADALAAINTTIDTELKDMAVADYDHKAFNDQDVKLQELNGKVAALSAKIALYKEYQAIYNKLEDSLKALQDAIDADSDFNDNETTDPATEFWADKIKELQEAKDALANQIGEAYNDKYADAKNNIKAQQGEFTQQIATLLRNAQLLQENMAANEHDNTLLLGISNNVRTAINTEIDNLKEKQEAATAAGNTELATTVEGWIKALNNLLINSTEPEDLAAVDKEENAAFAIGEADDQFEALKKKYDDVNTKFKELQAQYNEAFGTALEAWNNSFLKDQWPDSYDALIDAYRNAITTYDQYLYGLTNPGYKEAIAPVLKDHRGIYEYIDQINELNTTVNDWVNGQTAAGKLISQTAYDEQATDKKDGIIEAIDTKVNTMKTDVANKALEYYSELHATTETTIADQEAALEAAGNVEDVIAETFAAANKEKADADELFTKYADSLEIGIQMDYIATDLDNAIAAATAENLLEKAVEKQWKDYDLEGATAALQVIDEKVADAEFCDPEVKDDQQEIIDQAKAAIADLSTKTATVEEGDNQLKVLQAALEAALNNAENAATAIENNSKANKAEQDEFAKWEGILKGLNTNLESLEKFVNGLGAGYQQPVQDALATAESKVAALEQSIKDNKGNLLGENETLTNVETAAKEAISNTYGTAVFNEKALLKEWYGKLQAAYNDAKVNSGIEDFDNVAEYKAIKEFIDANADNELFNTVFEAETFNADKYLTDAVEFESELATDFIVLEKTWSKDANGNANPDLFNQAKAAVAAAEDACGEALDAASEAFFSYENLQKVDEETYNEFLQKYQDIVKEYGDIQGAVAGEANRLLLNYQKFVDEYNDLKAEIEKVAADAKTAAEAADATAAKWGASDAAAATLENEYNGLVADFEALKAKVEEYGIDNTPVNQSLADIQERLDVAKADLDAKKAAHALTADSTLYDAHGIASAIESTACAAAKVYAQDEVAAAWAENTKINNLFSDKDVKIVPEIKEALKAEKADLKVELEKVQNDIKALDPNDLDNPATAADYEALHDQAQAIKDRLAAMLDEAKENVFVPGDVNLDPNGIVNVADVQLLIQWVGEGKTYADLYAMNPVIAAAANVAQELGETPVINIADVTKEIEIAMNFDFNTPTTRSMVQRRAAAEGSINATLIGSENGNYRYAIALNSTQSFVAGQIDFVLPAGCEIVSAEMVGMSHQLYQFNNDGYTRMIVASMVNAEIAGDQLLIIEVAGQGAPQIDAAVFTDANANAYTLGSNATTGIDGTEAENGMVQRIYNAAGQAMRTIQRGINIIRHNDGTVTKELHK